MASVHSLPPADRALYAKLHHILNESGLVVGSLVTLRRTCGKRTCRCQKGPRYRHRCLCLAVRVGRKRRLLYVPSAWEVRVTAWVGRYGDVRELLTQISRSFVRRLLERQE